MAFLLALVIPTLTILTPLAILILVGRGKNNRDRTEFSFAILGCFLTGLIVPIIATYISARGLTYNMGPNDVKCVTGAGVFFFFGYLINLIGVPIAGAALFPSKRLTKN